MQVLGRNLPSIQTAINSGFENVTAGITEVASHSGISALDSAFDSFSETRFGAAADVDLMPAVSVNAEYPGPIEAFNNLASDNSDLSKERMEVLQTLKDPAFRPEMELANLSTNTRQIILGPGSRLNRPFGEPNLMPWQDNVIKRGAEHKGSEPPPIIEGGADPKHFKGRPLLGDIYTTPTVAYELSDPRSPVSEIFEGATDGPYQPTNRPRIPVSKANTSVEGRGARLDAGNSAPTSNDDPLAARGIIIVGGKTEGTYLDTIDDTIHELQTNPQPETQQMLQEQLAAVQDMTSTAQQTVDLYRQLSTNSLLNGMGIMLR